MGTAIAIMSVIFALGATVLAFIFIVPENRRSRMNKFGKFLHDTLNFKYLTIEKILQALYIFTTALVIMFGFFMLFYVQQGRGYYSRDQWYGLYGLVIMIVGPIVLRIVYEGAIMAILLVKNVIQINNKLKTTDSEGTDIFKTPTKEDFKVERRPVERPVAPSAPAERFCSNCGEKLGEGVFCHKCGTKN